MKGNEENATPLLDIFTVFVRLGFTSFGGPAAHIAMMEDEVVGRRQWVTHEAFLDLVGATNLIPGPNSTEMAIHIGYLRAGWRGLVIAGLSFILPAVFLSGFLAVIYARVGSLPDVAPFLLGTTSAVIAVIAGSAFRLGTKAIGRRVEVLVIGIVAFAASLCQFDPVLILFGGGLLGGFGLYAKRREAKAALVMFPFTTSLSLTSQTATVAGGATLFKLGLVFLKVGALLYGSGYVLIAFLRESLVDNLGWLTQKQLLDAIAVGQFTPGPVLSTATFIGYQILGVQGAIIATAGIFLPSFVFVAIANPLIPRLRRSPLMSAFLDAVNVTSIALIAAVATQLAWQTLTTWLAVAIALTSLLIIIRTKVNPAWLVIGGGAVALLWSIVF